MSYVEICSNAVSDVWRINVTAFASKPKRGAFFTRWFHEISTKGCYTLWQAPLPTARQHPSYGDCLEVKREYYQNSSVPDCVTQCSQYAEHLYEQLLQVQQVGFVTLGP